MSQHDLLDVLHQAADAVADVLASHDDWGLSGQRAGQYVSDVAADEAARTVLGAAGLAVLSEESGISGQSSRVAVLDPLDGSTNASRGLPWFATSIAVVADGTLVASVVHDHVSGVRWDAAAGGGARVDGARLEPRVEVPLAEAIIAVNGLPPRNPGWGQFRAYGAAALDLCAVADGRFDGFVDYDNDALGPWDYLGATLICQEAGVDVADAFGRPLVVVDHDARRTPVAGVGAGFSLLQRVRAGDSAP